MKINQMEYFAQVCRLGSITRAARELHVSQPSVTAAIHELERELGVSLFSRRNNKLYLTEEGDFVLDRVTDILRDVERLDRDLKGFVGTKNLIRLGVPLQIGACLLPLLFGKFRKLYPEVKLEIQESGAMDIVRALLDDQLDMAIVSIDTSRQWDVNWTPLYESQFCFCVAAGHPLAGRESITFEEACGQPLVAFKEGFYVNERIRQRMEECGVKPELRMRTEQLHTVKNLVVHGGCGAFLLKEAVLSDPLIRPIPMDPPMTARIGVITRKGRPMYSDSRKMLSFIKEEFAV
ncbi:MAG: LysR family transcriptional regulator [Enterocloster asparagiformis]|nr:LysR family transcriptional regulator [Enterocloster asparagiformis]